MIVEDTQQLKWRSMLVPNRRRSEIAKAVVNGFGRAFSYDQQDWGESYTTISQPVVWSGVHIWNTVW